VLIKYKNRIFKEYCENFNKISTEKGIWYKTIQTQPRQIPWFANTSLNRKLVVMAFKLRSGHIPLNKFKHLMRKTDSPNCDNCGMPEDIYHFLMECVRSEPFRTSFLSRFNISRNNIGIFQSVLAEPESEAARALCSQSWC